MSTISPFHYLDAPQRLDADCRSGQHSKDAGHQPGRTSDQLDDADAADGEPGRE